MLTKKFFEDCAELELGVSPTEIQRTLFNDSWQMVTLRTKLSKAGLLSTSKDSPSCCGVAELYGLYPHAPSAQYKPAIISQILMGCQKKKGLFYFYMPKAAYPDPAYGELAAILTSYGFVDKATFRNPNTGNYVHQFENNVGNFMMDYL